MGGAGQVAGRLGAATLSRRTSVTSGLAALADLVGGFPMAFLVPALVAVGAALLSLASTTKP